MLTADEVAAKHARLKARQERALADEKAARALLASPAGEQLLRFLRRLWVRRGLDASSDRTAYRVALRDAVEQLEEIRADAAGR